MASLSNFQDNSDGLDMSLSYASEGQPNHAPSDGEYPLDFSFDLSDLGNNLDLFRNHDQHHQYEGHHLHTLSPDPRQYSDRVLSPMQLMGMGESMQSNGNASGSNHAPRHHSESSQGPDNATSSDALKDQLAKQLQLQRLQRLQNQLLQQQIDVLSGGGSLLDQNNGLLTPLSSSEIQPTLHRDFVSPMILQQNQNGTMYPDQASQAYYSLMSPAMTPVVHGHQAMTAPASLVFHRSGHVTPSGEYFSPLTSPALGPVVYPTNYDPQSLPENAGFHPSPLDRVSPPNDSGKRTTRTRKRRSSVDEPAPSKRIHSPVVKPTAPKPRPSTRASQVKTPSTRATRPRRGSANVPSGSGASPQSPGEFGLDAGMPQNTPSPVDLSMPPPSHPAPRRSGSPPPADSSHPIAPVTPGSIMNLGHMSTFTMTSRLSSQEERSPMLPTHPIISSSSATGDASTSARQEIAPPAITKKTPRTKKGAGSTRSKVPPSSTVQNSPAIRPMVSPSLKPLLPEGTSADAISHLSLKSNYQNILEGRGQDLGISFPQEGHTGVEVKKHSHRDAEQKRRDSLKAGFDDLRLLLPPITHDPAADPSDPPIPGSNPPRGPARHLPGLDSDHPNRGVSKLALLRHSNEYIVKLKRRVSRRDDAIEQLREELKALRIELSIDSASGTERGGRVLMDLEEDIDEIERNPEEERDKKAAARPTERALASLNNGIGGSSNGGLSAVAEAAENGDGSNED